MLTGIKSKFTPTAELAETLSQWIGCARVIYNAKCDEDKYLRTYARKYLSVGTYPELSKGYSEFKTELTPWLKDCPSQILRNSATIWYQTYQRFFKGLCARPKRKTKAKGNYIWLTRELFRMAVNGSTATVELGTVAKPIGSISVRFSKKRVPTELPASIWIRKTNAGWSIAFAYENGVQVQTSSAQEHLDYLRTLDAKTLSEMITPVDRGIARLVQTDASEPFKFDAQAEKKFLYRDKLVRRFQRKLARQQKGSNHRKRTLERIAKLRAKDAAVREDFWHKTTRTIVNTSKIVVIEDLKLKNMVRRPKPKKCEVTGKWLRNGARAKAGLNKSLLDAGIYKFEQFISYKLAMADKPLFKVSPHYTSQECASCGHTHSENRKTQSDFKCITCGHADNADHNAAMVILKRAVNLILDSGTELAGKQGNLLRSGTGANQRKTSKASDLPADDCLSKKKAA